MKTKYTWLFKPSFINILCLLLGITLNILGSGLAIHLNAPFWLDSLGTAFCACLLGPLAGSVTGISAYIFCHLTNPIIWLYAISSIPMSVCFSILYQETKFHDFFQLLSTGALAATISMAFSIPLNLLFFGGRIENLWGDALVDMLLQNGNGALFSCFFGQAFIDIPDKIISLLIAFLLIQFPELLRKFRKGGTEK